MEIRAADRRSDSSLPHYLQELAKVYEAQEKYAAAEELYRGALKISEELDQPKDFLIVRVLDALARFCNDGSLFEGWISTDERGGLIFVPFEPSITVYAYSIYIQHVVSLSKEIIFG